MKFRVFGGLASYETAAHASENMKGPLDRYQTGAFA